MLAKTIKINGKIVTVEAPGGMPLLWVIRDRLHLKGTRYGCGIGQCGSCTVLLDGVAKKSCLIPFSTLNEESIITIEGLSRDEQLHPVQQAWLDEQVSQCGYCQSGQVLAATALLNKYPTPTDEQLNTAMKEVLCRCGSYPRIKKAIQRASRKISDKKDIP